MKCKEVRFTVLSHYRSHSDRRHMKSIACHSPRAVMTQEMASQGLSVIYQLGNADVREKLLSSLMGTLQGEHALSVTCLQDARKPLECKSTLTYKFHNTTCMFLACLPARFCGH